MLSGETHLLVSSLLDIAFAISIVSQFMHTPYEVHLDVVYHILKYLKETTGRGLFFKNGLMRGIQVFTDAD